MDLLLGTTGAYLLGSIPFAWLLVRLLAGIDVRTIGSGNSGATNASRAFRPPWRLPMFLLIYVLDFAKGFVPTLLAWQYLGADAAAAEGTGASALAAEGTGASALAADGTGASALAAAVVVGAAAILGHCTSPFLGFRGGKGVATATGVFAWLTPVVLAVALLMFFLVRLLTREVFLGSLSIGLTLAIGVIVEDPGAAFGSRWPLTTFALVIAAFLFYTHRGNIRNYRLNGTDEDPPIQDRNTGVGREQEQAGRS